ncbi:MAG: galactokinase [Bacteroidales bacterium]|nr:galactokinase [Deltaproteobacteria bacterium]MBL7138162.1 galactokinase [Bacteroidales bacterium]
MDHQSLFDLFFQHFGKPEQLPAIYFAPGRVNLIGEHTDYNGGFVLPCALQYGTYLLIRQVNEPVIRLASTNVDFQTEVPLSGSFTRMENHWVNYPLGVMDQFQQRKISIGGMELLFSGDIPNNAGLSSSASIEMVTAFALKELLDADLSLVELIKLSQKAENQFVGVNCGIMDQFAVGMGEKAHAIFLNCKTLENKMVPVLLDGISMVVANTNKQRGLADSKYNERVAECQLAVTYLSKLFDISQLSEISFMQFYKVQEQIPDEVLRRRARHVISENQRVLNAVSCLWNNNILEFGALMNASHESLRDNYEVTGFELDTLVAEAQKIHGVVGSRMTGAGFGGCTVSLVTNEALDHFREEVGKRYHEKTGLTADFYVAEVSDGVRIIPLPQTYTP